MNQDDDELFQILEESTSDVTYKVGLDDRFTYLSPTVKEMFGYEPEELVGVSIRDILTPEAYQKQREGMEKALGENRTEADVLVLEVKKKNGEKVAVEVCARFDKGADGQVVGILGTAKYVKKGV